MKTFVSDLSGKQFSARERIPAASVREALMELMQRDHPDFDDTKFLALSELNAYRGEYITRYLEREVGDLSKLDGKVLEALKNHTTLSDKTAQEDEEKIPLGDRVADKVASFGGSWTFIIIFGCILLFWIVLNAVWLSHRAFDPYPFILMNLVLSCLAAVQAPIIMMSQNRQAEIDRKQAENDYMVNLKSEIEVRSLHDKLDHLMLYQQQELFDMQKTQIEMLAEVQKQLKK